MAAKAAKSTCVAMHVHDDHYFLREVLHTWKSLGPTIVFVSRTAWDGSEGDWKKSVAICNEAGVEFVEGSWASEDEQRDFAYKTLAERGFVWAFTPDTDEFPSETLIDHLNRIVDSDLADCVHVCCDTYWKSPEFVIRPREGFRPLILVKLADVRQGRLREVIGGRQLVLSPEHGVIHHLSYAGPDERIQRKIKTFSHSGEIVDGWLENVWRHWDQDPTLRNLHPTHPAAYGFAERISIPSELEAVAKLFPKPVTKPDKSADFPTVSVIIPLHGGSEEIKACLDGLEKCRDLLHEVIVVDNASPDDAAKVAQGFQFVDLIANESNEGFAKACNQGLARSTGECIIFLNSDAVMTRRGLIELVRSLKESRSVGAVAPHTNYAVNDQQIEPSYTSLDTLELFAETWADRDVGDKSTDFLIGFCFCTWRAVLDEIGSFDESFGLGTFEDADLCYRFRRKGYQLKIAAKSYMHHFGSRTLKRLGISTNILLRQNEARYRAKWQRDINAGFASHLPPLSRDPIKFDENRSPERIDAQIRKLAQRANLSLCMIVRNEERVLADCLSSFDPYFTQIVIVDTGSTDQTIEIAKSFGAEVYEMVWPDSFSVARNESLKHAKGDWIFWTDADDENGNRVSVRDLEGSITTYAYDDKDRLTQDLTTGTNAHTYDYSYDSVDNRRTSNETGSVVTYAYDAASRLTTSPDSTTYTFDDNGNLTNVFVAAASHTTMAYVKENRLSVHSFNDGEGSTSIATFTYDGDGLKRRELIDGVATTLVWDGSDYLQQRT